MNSQKTSLLTVCLCLSLTSYAQNVANQEFTYRIPVGENSLISHNQREDGKMIKKKASEIGMGPNLSKPILEQAMRGN